MTTEKARRRSSEIYSYVENRTISSQELEKLISNFGFSQTNLFGKYARTQLRPLYRKFCARNFRSKLSNYELHTFSGRSEVLRSLKPRVPRPSNRKPDFIIYTDAALLARKIAALAISTPNGRAVIELLAEAFAPKAWMRRLHERNPIICMEMISP